MRVFVVGLGGTRYELDVSPSETVESLKLKVQDKTGTSPDAMRIVFAGKQLEDGRTLSDYNVLRDNTLHMVERLRGGCFVAGTPVTMADGTRVAIEGVQVGAVVRSFDVRKRAASNQVVVGTMRRDVNEGVCAVRVAADGHKVESVTLTLTSCHPVWVESKGRWCCVDPAARRSGHDDGVVTSQLEVGDVLRGADGGAMTVCGVDAAAATLDTDGLPTSTPVFNLTIADTHTYFAGGVLVHNNSGMLSAMAFSDMAATSRIAWGTTGPAYYTATYGLNLEGKCRNAACEAVRAGHRVILPVGEVRDAHLAELIDEKTCPAVSVAGIVAVRAVASLTARCVLVMAVRYSVAAC
jgi:hypothetical protein